VNFPGGFDMPKRFVPTPKRTKPSVIKPLPDDDTAWSRLPSVLHYAGMGHTKFYELVGKQLMPRPKLICGRSYWRAGEIREAVKWLEGGFARTLYDCNAESAKKH
jgi:predicted DNA-binding transcriptional regulator AlpA